MDELTYRSRKVKWEAGLVSRSGVSLVGRRVGGGGEFA